MSRKPMPVGTHGRITVTPYADGGKTRLHGEGKSWRRPDGIPVPMKQITWIARCRFRDNDGRTRPVEAWGPTRTGAEQNLQNALTSRKRTASNTITADTRLEVLADYWLRTKIETSDRSVNTKQRYRDVTEHDIIPGLGGLRLRECTVSRLEAWVAAEAAEHAATARLCLTCLRGMFDVAVREDAITANPARSVSPIPVEASEVRALELSDVIKLRAALAESSSARAQELADLVDVMLATGCRVGEALALRWADVDLEEHIVYITGTVVREQGVRLFRQDTTKGRKPRGHPVPAFALAMLERRRSEVPANDLDLVFPSVRGGLREVSTIDKQWRKFREWHPEWVWITPKTFRKTVATVVQRGADIEAAAAQLGHANASITAKHYVERITVGPDHREILEQFGR